MVGGGVGGLCAAIRLAVAGHHVKVFERNAVMGGKLATRERDGFRFDIGPSLLTLPEQFDEVFRLAGSCLAEEVDLIRLDPHFRYHWPDGSSLDLPGDRTAAADAIETFSPGSRVDWLAFMDRADQIWAVSRRTFFAGAMSSPLSLLVRLRSPRDLFVIDAQRSLQRAATAAFKDPRLQQWACRYATYSGSSPFRAPATLACIPALEMQQGAWYVRGGLTSLRDALVRACVKLGVELHPSTEVATVVTDGGRVRGIRTVADEHHGAEVVVANVDAEHLYADLVPHEAALRRVRRAEPSGSGFVVLCGVRGVSLQPAHHQIWFSSDYTQEYADLDAGRSACEPTVYACVSSVSDPTQAPADHENWFLLVNAPADAGSMAGYEDVVLDRLAQCGVDLHSRLLFTETMSPADIEQRYRSPHGSIYGSSSNGRRAAFARPPNRGPIRGLYLVGGSSHPGGGLPLVAISARIVADLIARDRW